jgi:putative transposase
MIRRFGIITLLTALLMGCSESYKKKELSAISGFINSFSKRVPAIFCLPDHIHILISVNPTTLAADLVRNIKSNSTIFIKEQGIARNFAWQEG